MNSMSQVFKEEFDSVVIKQFQIISKLSLKDKSNIMFFLVSLGRELEKIMERALWGDYQTDEIKSKMRQAIFRKYVEEQFSIYCDKVLRSVPDGLSLESCQSIVHYLFITEQKIITNVIDKKLKVLNSA